MSSTLEKWVTMKDVQEHIGATRETITQWINNKNMPAYKVGRSWKFKLSEVDNWVRSNGAAEEKYSAEN